MYSSLKIKTIIYMKRRRHLEISEFAKSQKTYGGDSKAFINAILYGEDTKDQFGDPSRGIRRTLNPEPLNDYIQRYLEEDGHKIKEKLGTYYLEDRMDKENNREYTINGKENPSEISDVNKRDRRVITYEFE